MPTETLPWNSSGSFAPGFDFHDDGSYKPEPYKRKVSPRYPVDIPGVRDSDWASEWMKEGCGCSGNGGGCSCNEEEKEPCCGSCAEGLPCEGGTRERPMSIGISSIEHILADLGINIGAEIGDTDGSQLGCCRLEPIPPFAPDALTTNDVNADLYSDAAACEAAGGVWDYLECSPHPPAGLCCCVTNIELHQPVSRKTGKTNLLAGNTFKYSISTQSHVIPAKIGLEGETLVPVNLPCSFEWNELVSKGKGREPRDNIIARRWAKKHGYESDIINADGSVDMFAYSKLRGKKVFTLKPLYALEKFDANNLSRTEPGYDNPGIFMNAGNKRELSIAILAKSGGCPPECPCEIEWIKLEIKQSIEVISAIRPEENKLSIKYRYSYQDCGGQPELGDWKTARLKKKAK